jgi:hypothetical protein
MAVQRHNYQKVINRIRAKAQCEWDKLVIIVEQCPPLPKTNFGQINFKALLQVLGLRALGMGKESKMQHHGWRSMKIYKK